MCTTNSYIRIHTSRLPPVEYFCYIIQPAFTYSELTIKIVEQGVEYVQS